MLTTEQNELLTWTGPGTPMGDVMRRYWMPALLTIERRGDLSASTIDKILSGNPSRAFTLTAEA